MGRALAHPDFTIRFWGVRGSIACPGPATARYGGNTSCIEVRCGDHLLVFDGGSGMRGLGAELLKGGYPRDFDLFYTHTHLDHVHGLPFFPPCYDPRTNILSSPRHLKPTSSVDYSLS